MEVLKILRYADCLQSNLYLVFGQLQERSKSSILNLLDQSPGKMWNLWGLCAPDKKISRHILLKLATASCQSYSVNRRHSTKFNFTVFIDMATPLINGKLLPDSNLKGKCVGSTQKGGKNLRESFFANGIFVFPIFLPIQAKKMLLLHCRDDLIM